MKWKQSPKSSKLYRGQRRTPKAVKNVMEIFLGNAEKEIAMHVLLEQLAVREGIGYTIRVYHCGYTSVEREIVTLELQTVVMVVVSDIRT